jgi:hypothetical protein
VEAVGRIEEDVSVFNFKVSEERLISVVSECYASLFLV